MIPNTFEWISIILIEVSMLPYIISIMKGDTKPHRITNMVWALLGLVQFFSNLDLNNLTTIVVSFAMMFNPVVILLFSIKRGMPGVSKFDILCLIGVVFGFAALFIFKRPLEALLLTACIDFLGALPLIRKSFFHPKTENIYGWGIYFFGTVFNLAAITSFNFINSFFPVYLIVEAALVVGAILLGQMRLDKLKAI